LFSKQIVSYAGGQKEKEMMANQDNDIKALGLDPDAEASLLKIRRQVREINALEREIKGSSRHEAMTFSMLFAWGVYAISKAWPVFAALLTF
jgi:hypothetical protein